jgi:hypothetical protein
MQMELRDDRTWVGAGIKVGGIAIAGAETFEGVATRLDSWRTTWLEVNVTGIRLGLGLGGSIGASVFFAFNVGTLYEVNNTVVTDWGLNIAVPSLKANLKSLGVAINLEKYLDSAGRVFLKRQFIGNMTPEKLAKLRDLASVVYNSTTEGAAGILGGEPKLLVLDVPGAGWGAELSVFATGGEFTVGDAVAA